MTSEMAYMTSRAKVCGDCLEKLKWDILRIVLDNKCSMKRDATCDLDIIEPVVYLEIKDKFDKFISEL